MTSLRQRMAEEMQIRNLSTRTQETYLRNVAAFARYFKQSPELLGTEEIRKYQLYLSNERKLAVSTMINAVAALRFFYKFTLKRRVGFRRDPPFPEETNEIACRPQPRGSPALSELRAQSQASRDLEYLLCRRLADNRGPSPHYSRH